MKGSVLIMFIIQKFSRKKYSLIVISFLICTLFIISITLGQKAKSQAMCSSIGEYSLKAETIEEQILFLEQFGWKVEKKPIEEQKIIIPQDFNKVYENYNNIQKNQGLNLEKYKGKECSSIRYDVKNYPKENSNVVANLIIYKGKVIAGDISKVTLDGFMHGFEYEKIVK